MHLTPLIQDLAVILGIAGIMSLIFHKIRQPVVLGYMIAGVVIGPYTPPFQLVTDIPSIRIWAELGVIFLMFSLGLEFRFRKLMHIGAPAALIALIEVCFFLPTGIILGTFFGWSKIEGLFLGAMLTVSSTTVLVKALGDLGLKSHRFAELIFGVLIVEDMIAILLLVGLTTFANNESISAIALLTATTKLLLVVGSWFIAGYFILPRFMRYAGRTGSNEMIMVLSLGLCLGLVVLATKLDYSPALGAFIMGSILSESAISDKIESRIESLRELFGAVFFVSIGMLLNPVVLWENKGIIVILTGVIVFGKILFAGFGSLVSGQTLKDSVRVGFGLTQIGEFSFIIAGLGISMGVTNDYLSAIAVALCLVTTFTTPYFIKLSETVAHHAEKLLPKNLKLALDNYAAWNERRRTASGKESAYYKHLARWLINGITVSVIFTLCSTFLAPYLRNYFQESEFKVFLLSWAAAVLISAPFIWGMSAAFKTFHLGWEIGGTSLGTLPLLFYRTLTLLWIAALSFEFFPAGAVAVATTLSLLGFLGVFYKQLEGAYHWFEKTFLSTFEENSLRGIHPTVSKLAPWDAHLVRISVHPNAIFAGKEIQETQLRNKYGLNIVSIQRGAETRIAPTPHERLFPMDELTVLGTDRDIASTRECLESPSAATQTQSPDTEYELRHFEIGERGLLRGGVSIRNSKIRESFRSMVVGVERGAERIINPDSDLVLKSGDCLWIVGPREELRRLIKETLLHI